MKKGVEKICDFLANKSLYLSNGATYRAQVAINH